MAEKRLVFEPRDIKSIRIRCERDDCEGEVIFPPNTSTGHHLLCPVCNNSVSQEMPSVYTVRRVLCNETTLRPSEPRLFMEHVDKGFQPGVFVRSEPGFS